MGSTSLKWVRITSNYLEKYKSFLDAFFDLVEQGHIKIRIMFTQNVYSPRNLDDYQIDNQYFLLYYQLIKHAFGLRYANPNNDLRINVSLLLDDVPEKMTVQEGLAVHLEGRGSSALRPCASFLEGVASLRGWCGCSRRTRAGSSGS